MALRATLSAQWQLSAKFQLSSLHRLKPLVIRPLLRQLSQLKPLSELPWQS